MWPARLVARLPRVPRFAGASSNLFEPTSRSTIADPSA